MPLIVSMPNSLPAGVVYEKPVIALDLLPTALKLAGRPIPDTCDGVDLFPYLKGEKTESPHSTLYWRVAGGDGFAMREGVMKLVHDIGMERPELYDLSKDIGENVDLSNSMPDKLSQMLAKYSTWSNRLERPRWTDGHIKNTTGERAKAQKSGTRQFPMSWSKDGSK